MTDKDYRTVWVVFFDGYEEGTRIDGEVALLTEAEAAIECSRRQAALRDDPDHKPYNGSYSVASIKVPR